MLHRLFAGSAAVVALMSFCAAIAGATSERTEHATVHRSVISVNDAPFFPVMLIDQCSGGAASRARRLGINLILNEHCSSLPARRQLTMLSGKSLAVLPIQDRALRGRGLIGWTYPDEPENNGWTPSSLRRSLPYARGNADGLLSFVTTGAGFFHSPYRDRAVPPREYGQFARMSDVAGFDLYPLGHCHDDLSTVYDAQREFVRLAGAMPTFQWIETGPIRPTYCGGFEMTSAELRAEVWLAIVGGARGIGYFTHTWSPRHKAFDVRPQLQRTIRRISDLLAAVRPGLLGQTAVADANSGGIAILARETPDRVYVFAVNDRGGVLPAQLHVPLLAHGPLQVFGEHRSVVVNEHRFDDTFEPLGVHIYVQRR